MKKTLIILLILILGLVGCSNANIMEDTPIDNEDTGIIENIKIDYDNLQDYKISKSFWYSDDTIIFAFEQPGEKEFLKLLFYNTDTNKEELMYEEQVLVQNTDSFMENAEEIGYQNEEKVLFFNKDTLQLSSEYAKPNTVKYIQFSPDMKYLAQIEDSGLYILNRDLDNKILLNNNEDKYIGLNWADDNSKLLYIDNSYSDVNIIDINSKTKTIIQGDKDFKYPDNIVDLLSCRLLPNSNDVLVNMLCENGNSLAVLYNDKNYESTIIAEDGENTVLDVNNSVILYSINKNSSNENQLVHYDYANENKKVINSTSDYIICADISPDGNRVVVGTYKSGNSKLYIVPIK